MEEEAAMFADANMSIAGSKMSCKSMIPAEAFDEIIKELRRKPLDTNHYRKLTGDGKSQAFGVVNKRCLKPDFSRQCWLRPYLYKLLLDFAEKYVDIPWTSVTVNQNYAAGRHRDRGNIGESYLVAFGDYTGGELKFWEGERAGIWDINKKPIVADFSELEHSVEPFEGERYSLVFYVCRGEYILPEPSVRLVNGEWRFFRGEEECHGLPHPLQKR